MFKMIAGLFKTKEPVKIDTPLKIMEPRLNSFRVREITYGSGRKIYFLEQYRYPNANEYVAYSLIRATWREESRYDSEHLACKAQAAKELEQYNNTVILDKVINCACNPGC